MSLDAEGLHLLQADGEFLVLLYDFKCDVGQLFKPALPRAGGEGAVPDRHNFKQCP